LEVLEYVDMGRSEDRELVITAKTAATAGEEVTLYLADETGTVSIRGRVIESRRQVVNGDVRHQVRLERLDKTPAPRGAGVPTE
jgi:hypothetical protein